MKHGSIILVASAIILGILLIIAAGFFASDGGVKITGEAVRITPSNDGSFVVVSGVQSDEDIAEAHELVDDYFDGALAEGSEGCGCGNG